MLPFDPAAIPPVGYRDGTIKAATHSCIFDFCVRSLSSPVLSIARRAAGHSRRRGALPDERFRETATHRTDCSAADAGVGVLYVAQR